MSARPGTTNLPFASITVALDGTTVVAAGPTPVMREPSMTTTALAMGEDPAPSTVAPEMAVTVCPPVAAGWRSCAATVPVGVVSGTARSPALAASRRARPNAGDARRSCMTLQTLSVAVWFTDDSLEPRLYGFQLLSCRRRRSVRSAGPEYLRSTSA